MKLNKRLLVTSGLLLALSTVATSTATYAWFTVNRTATAAVADISVNTGADLEYRLESTGGQTATTEGQWLNSTALQINGGVLRDISGNGCDFYKPTLASNNTTITAIETIDAGVYSGNYVDAVISFRSSQAYNVLLGASTRIDEHDTGTQYALNNAARVAIFNTSAEPAMGNLSQVLVANAETPYAYEDPAPGDASTVAYYYMSGITATSTKVYSGTSGNRSAATGYSAFENNKVAIATALTTPNTMAGKALNQGVLCKLAKDGTYTPASSGVETDAYTGQIRIRVWIEGCDAECVYGNIKGKFIVNLNFITLADDAAD